MFTANKKFVLLSLFVLPRFALAADLYVSTIGNDSNLGSLSAPFRTIQKAASMAAAGTTVHVAAGTYAETISSTKSGTSLAPIRFVSDTKWGAKIIVPSTSTKDTAWDNRGSYVTIENFEVNCINSSKCLNGIYSGGSYSVIKGNHVHHVGVGAVCTGAGGSAVNGDSYYKGTNIDLINNVVHHIGTPTCSFIQGVYQSTTGTIKNNLVYQVGAAGLHLWHDAHNVDISNNTVFASGFGVIVGGGDFRYDSGGARNVHVANNIFVNNQYGISEQGITGTNNTYEHNLVFQNSIYNIKLRNGLIATGTIAADPQFIKYAADGSGDYHLNVGSPAIDRGINNYAPPADLDNVARPQGEGIDIGAYEFKEVAPPVLAPILSVSTSSLSFAN